MKPKAFVSAIVAMSMALGGPVSVFAQADRQEDRITELQQQQIQSAQQWQAQHGYQPPQGMRVYPAPQQPGYQQPGRPGYQQPGRPGNDPRRDGRNYNEYGAGPDHNFHPGERLPQQYRNHNYVVNDWRGHRLSPPPPGYQWVQTGADYVLIAIATGLIVQLLLQNN
jgi:Ni/Co efflux regulator RcnB